MPPPAPNTLRVTSFASRSVMTDPGTVAGTAPRVKPSFGVLLPDVVERLFFCLAPYGSPSPGPGLLPPAARAVDVARQLHQQRLAAVQEKHELLVVVPAVAEGAEQVDARVQPRAPRRLGVAHHLPRRLLSERLDAVLPRALRLNELRERVLADHVARADPELARREVGVARDVLQLSDVVRVPRVARILDHLEKPREGVLTRLRRRVEREPGPQGVPRANRIDQSRGAGVRVRLLRGG